MTATPLRIPPARHRRGAFPGRLVGDCLRRHLGDASFAMARISSASAQDIAQGQAVSGISAVICGRPEGFSSHEDSHVFQVTRPSAANGWRSETVLTASGDSFLTIELVTVLGEERRTPPIRPAETASRHRPETSEPNRRRAEALRAMARRIRSSAYQEVVTEEISVRFCPERRGCALDAFVGLIDLFGQREEDVLSALISQAGRLEAREIHSFGDLPTGDRMEMRSAVRLHRGARTTRIEVTGSATRRSDGTVMAICRSTWTQ